MVLRGFRCVSEFFRVLRSNDLRSAKTSLIPTFIDELKEKNGPEVTHLIEEAENLLIDRQAWVLIGVFPTGGNFNEVPDGLMRLQPGYAGARMSHVHVQASKYLADSHQLFQDRAPRPQRGEKGGDKGKGKGKPLGGKGKGGKARLRVPCRRWQPHHMTVPLSRRCFCRLSWPWPYPPGSLGYFWLLLTNCLSRCRFIYLTSCQVFFLGCGCASLEPAGCQSLLTPPPSLMTAFL